MQDPNLFIVPDVSSEKKKPLSGAQKRKLQKEKQEAEAALSRSASLSREMERSRREDWAERSPRDHVRPREYGPRRQKWQDYDPSRFRSRRP